MTRPYDLTFTRISEGVAMDGSGMAIAALVVVGILLVLVGIFLASGNLPLIALGVLALIAGGILSVWGRRTGPG